MSPVYTEETAQSPTEVANVFPQTLIASSKQKFMLAQARMHRQMYELVLLSLQGALEDALRSYLALRNHSAAQASYTTVLNVLLEDSTNPLLHDEVQQIDRMQKVQQRIATGNAVTLASETVIAYQHIVATLMARYGVLVFIPETLPLTRMPSVPSVEPTPSAPPVEPTPSTPPVVPTPSTTSPTEPEPEQQTPDMLQSLSHMWDKYRVHLAPLVGILLLFILASTAIIIIQQSRLAMDSPVAPTPTTTPSPTLAPFQSPSDDSPISTPTLPSGEEGELPISVPASNTTAYVGAGVGDGLALRTRPSRDEDTSIIIYLNAGTAVEIVDGPVEVDGFAWWKVRAANKEGWCAGEFLEFQ